MKENSWNFPFIGARLLFAFCTLTAVPTFAATTVSPGSTSDVPAINVEYETVRMLTASANGPIQVVAEDEATNDGKQIATSLPVTAAPPIDMSVKVRRPEFIPTCAFTNEEMVAPYHDVENAGANPNIVSTQELPKRIKLNPSVARHWTGAKVEPFWVNTTPDKDHPGTYSFSSEIENGPKGWLQHTGERSAWGHPEYRYWFDPS